MNKRTTEIFDALMLRFSSPKTELNFKNNFELLVSVVLSARCTDKRVNIITKTLFEKYPTPQALSQASLSDVEKIIYSCGFYKNKAKNLLLLSNDLITRFDGEVPSKHSDLTSLAGVGRKTANVVSFVGFDKPAIAVDTHVFRVSNRLALAPSKTPLECELLLQKQIDKPLWGTFHHLLVLFGRYVCKAQNPKCSECELTHLCSYYKDNVEKRPK